MKTQYWIRLVVKGANVRLLATISHAPYCGWGIVKLTYRGMVPGVAIHYTPSLIDDDQIASANQQIEDQMLADEIE